MEKNYWTDTHCHLDMLEENIPSVLKKAAQKEVGRIIAIATDKKSSEKVCNYVRSYPEVYGTVGIHPHDANAVQETDYDFITTQLVKEKKIIALGECGYDFHYNHSSYSEQKQVFCKQLEIALKTNYPIVIHSRESEKETMQTLLPFLKKGLKVLFHSFTSSQKLANFGIQFGCYFSFNGIITFANATHFLQLFKKIPIDRILLETDAPFLAPVPLRGKNNFPENVAIIGNFLANYLKMDSQKLQKITNKNAEKFFKGLI